MSTAQRPYSLNPSTLPPSEKKRPTSLQTRQPLGVISVQAQSFQERHRTQFAHLHQHSDDSLREKRLEAEKAELEAARRVGKEKRESVNKQRENKAAGRGKDGRRPLSLVVKQSNTLFGNERRSGSEDTHSRPNSLPLHSRAWSDAGFLSPSGRISRQSNGLNVVVESESARSETPNSYNPSLEDDHSPDVSIAQSSYSWASQFSGETEELRTAAHYIPRSSQEVRDGEEVLNDEDDHETLEDGTVRRRKKIVALAHTVRQLEGVGSREAEDPAFYDTLVKAWNERPVAPGHGGQAHFMSPMTDDNTSPLPYTPRSRHSEYTPFSHASDSGSTNLDHDTSRRSNSLRYSYASTLHDLALEGGIEQANRIFLAKPWLRGSILASSGKEEFLASNPPPLGMGLGGDAQERTRRLSMSGPPALAAPIDINDSKTLGQDLPRMNKPNGPIDFTASPEPSPAISDEAEGSGLLSSTVNESTSTTGPVPANGWGLGFVNNWFAPAPAPPTAETEPTALSRSLTVAQFDDAPNDDSLDLDAEGESDPELEYDDDDEDGEQVFHDAGEGVVTNTNTHTDSDPPADLALALALTTALPADIEDEGSMTRPESTLLPIPEPSPIPSSILEAMPLPPSPEAQASELDPSTPTSAQKDESTDSLSLNHYQQPPYSTPSITSYHQPLLAAVNHNLNLSTSTSRQNPVLVDRKSYEVRSARGSCHSSDSCSSPSTNVPTMGRRGSRPSLTPIITGLTTVEEPVGIDDESLVDHQAEDHQARGQEEESMVPEAKAEHDLVKNLRDERFSSAFKLAQSMNVPTPTIKSPVRTSSMNPNLHTSVLSLLSPSEEKEVIEDSNPYFYQTSSDASDMDLMMSGGPAPALGQATRARSLSVSGSTSGSVRGSMLSPLSPGRMSTSGSLPLASGSRLVVPNPNARNSRRPSLIELRTPTLGSISELDAQEAHVHGLPMIPLSGTAYSISGESEHLSEYERDRDLDSPSELPYSPGFSDSNVSLTSSRGASYLRPPSISDSYSQFTSISGRERPVSRYQMYQAQQAEKSRKANAIVAAKMAGATPKELKALSMAQRSPNPDAEKADSIVLPRPSTAAAVLFFIGFLGPWFWIIGGWWPLGHSSEIRQANAMENENEMNEGASVVLDFSGAENCWRGWKWTYHPDPWVKRNRRATAIGIPTLLVAGVAVAVVLALLL